MTKGNIMKRVLLTSTVAAVISASIAGAVPTMAVAQPVSANRPANEVTLSVGAGQMVRLNGTMSDLFVADDKVADVQVRSADQIYIFGKAPGETTVYATNKAGKVVYSASVRVGTNIGSVDQLLRVTMPDSRINVTPMNGVVVLTGTVAAPTDVEEANRIVQAFVGETTQVISRLKTATPLQVNLHVKIAEVSRSLMKQIGVNLASADLTSGFKFALGQGRSFSPQYTPGGPIGTGTEGGDGTTVVTPADVGTSLFGTGNLFGMNILAALDLAQQDGRVSLLAEPNLTALSGETASFLAGGEFPIAVSNGINGTSIEFKEYGVSLAFTPTVLEAGRISMRVRPEVSELTSQGAIKFNGTEIPALTTRRAETTVELGSGQSFVIGGLLKNTSNQTVDKAPWLGDLPILGALFRSNGFRRNETELVIVVTPYLVKPMNANDVALPTDGFRTGNDAERVLVGREHRSRTGERRPVPTVAAPVTPGIRPSAEAQYPQPALPAPVQEAQQKAVKPKQSASAAPGFSF